VRVIRMYFYALEVREIRPVLWCKQVGVQVMDASSKYSTISWDHASTWNVSSGAVLCQ
jgi:hypothetical protein